MWTSPKGAPFVPSAIIVDEQLYTINDMQSIVTSFEATTVDCKIFFTNDEGETFVLKAGPEFELLHVNRLGSRASPALVDGRWYFRTRNELICIGS